MLLCVQKQCDSTQVHITSTTVGVPVYWGGSIEMDPPDELGAISSHAKDIFRLGLRSFGKKFEAHT